MPNSNWYFLRQSSGPSSPASCPPNWASSLPSTHLGDYSQTGRTSSRMQQISSPIDHIPGIQDHLNATGEVTPSHQGGDCTSLGKMEWSLSVRERDVLPSQMQPSSIHPWIKSYWTQWALLPSWHGGLGSQWCHCLMSFQPRHYFRSVLDWSAQEPLKLYALDVLLITYKASRLIQIFQFDE